MGKPQMAQAVCHSAQNSAGLRLRTLPVPDPVSVSWARPGSDFLVFALKSVDGEQNFTRLYVPHRNWTKMKQAPPGSPPRAPPQSPAQVFPPRCPGPPGVWLIVGVQSGFVAASDLRQTHTVHCLCRSDGGEAADTACPPSAANPDPPGPASPPSRQIRLPLGMNSG